jgi:hypothetical protein
MTISFTDVYTKLVGWGYQVTKEPMEQKPAGVIQMKYNMRFKPEDVAMTSYEVHHEIRLDWVEATPDTLADSTKTLMRHLGAEYDRENRFELGEPRFEQSNGTLYHVFITISWVEWWTVNI